MCFYLESRKAACQCGQEWTLYSLFGTDADSEVDEQYTKNMKDVGLLK